MDEWALVAKAVNDRMLERGITQRELAERSGISVATLRKIQHAESQARRNRSTLASLSRALGFRDDYLWRIATEAPSSGGGTIDALVIDDLRADLAELRARVEVLEARQGTATDERLAGDRG
jgi:transcriptional regulator with XRE-family HTH domain